MVKKELQALWHNKLLMVVLLVIILIPAMYAGFFLASMWDPYGDLEYLPVAVVNKDNAVTYNDEELTIGEDLAENLAENDSMAFNVVDEDTANKGLENGTYYMVITIPEDFSQNASTLMDENPKQMVLDYKTNPGRNYISMKLSESAVKEIKANLTQEITHTYAETVFESLETIEDGFQDAVDGTDDMLEGESQLLDGNATITENLLVLSDGAETLATGSTTLENGLVTYTNGVKEVHEGINGDLKTGVNQIANSLPDIATLNQGAQELNAALPQYTTGVNELYAGATKLTGYNTALSQGVNQMAVGNDRVKSGIASAIQALGYSTDQAVAAYQQYASSQTLGAENSSTVEETITTTTSVDEQKVETLQGYVTGTSGSLNSAQSTLATAQTGVDNASVSVGQAQEVLTSFLQDDTLMEEQRTKIGNVDALLGTIATSLGSTSENMQTVASDLIDASGSIGNLSEETLTGAATQTIETKEASIVGAPTSNVSQAIVALGGAYAGTSSIQQGFYGDGTTQNIGFIESLSTYTEGVSSLKSGAGKLSGNNEALTGGTTRIAGGTDTLYQKLNTGAPKLVNGVAKLGEGTSKLVANRDTLVNGANKLSEGASQIEEGAIKLANGSEELGDGLVTLKDGTGTLHDALADGKEELSENEASDATLDMFAEPVVAKETTLTDVENNGHAMAAYMFSVGIWVACLAFCLMYPLSRYTGELTNGKDWWLSKAVVLYPMAILMVVMLLVIMHFALGFNPGSMTKTLMVALAAVACFMSIMYFFNLLLGKVGSFLMLLFMVLQLAGSAGTYPVEISGKLAQTLNKWMPFTYSVNGFRAGIATNGPEITKECIVLFAISIVFTLLTIGVFRIRSLRTKQGKPFLYDWLEEKGLA